METRDALMDAVRNYPAPTLLAKLILVFLATYANRLGENIYPGWKTLLAQTQASKSTITRAIKALISDGILIKVSGGNNHRPGQYRINTERLLPSLVVLSQTTTNENRQNLVVVSLTPPDDLVVVSETLPTSRDARAVLSEERLTEEREAEAHSLSQFLDDEKTAHEQEQSPHAPSCQIQEQSVAFEEKQVNHDEEKPEPIALPELADTPQPTPVLPAEGASASEERTSPSCEVSAEPLSQPDFSSSYADRVEACFESLYPLLCKQGPKRSSLDAFRDACKTMDPDDVVRGCLAHDKQCQRKGLPTEHFSTIKTMIEHKYHLDALEAEAAPIVQTVKACKCDLDLPSSNGLCPLCDGVKINAHEMEMTHA